MKRISSLALAAALVAGVGSSIAVPAVAKKEEAAKGPNLSAAVRTPAVAAQTALAATPPDITAAEAALVQIDAAKKNDDEKYVADAIRVAIQQNKLNALPEAQRTYADLAATLDSLIANPATPKDKVPTFLFARANLAFNAHQYDVAGKLYTRARDAGFQDPDLAINLAKAEIEAGQVQQGSADMDAAVKVEVAAGRKPPESWYRYMISRLYRAKDANGTLQWTRGWLANYGTKENWRDAIISFGFQANGRNLTDRQLVDLYRLMHATHSLGGQKEWIDYAGAALKVGLPTEAKAVIAEGLETKVIPAGNVTATEYAKQAQQGIASDKSLTAQESAAKAASTGASAAGTGDAYLGARNYTKAVEMYRLALSKGVTDTDLVNVHLGIALTLANDKTGGQAAFDAVKAAPYSDIAKLWTTYLLTPPAA